MIAALVSITAACGGPTDPADPGPIPERLGFTVQPSETVMGWQLRPAPEVEVLNADGRRITSSTDSVSITADGLCAGLLSGTLTVAAVAGVAVFDDVVMDGDRRLCTLTARPTDNSFNAVVSAEFRVTGFRYLTAAKNHACGLTWTRHVYCWGDLDGGVTIAREPVRMGAQTDMLFGSLASGGTNSCGWSTTIRLVACWGENAHGQLGDGTTTPSAEPVEVPGSEEFGRLGVGDGFVCGMGVGPVYCWGRNDVGQLGNGTTLDAAAPQEVSGGLTFFRFDVGGNHACGWNSYDLFCWGDNTHGQLGTDSVAISLVPIHVEGFRGDTVQGGQGYGCSVDTWLFCWGDNREGQVGSDGVGDGTSSWTRIPVGVRSFATGFEHTCVANDVSWCWGLNDRGQLGNGTTTPSREPVQVDTDIEFFHVAVGSGFTCAMEWDGAVFCWGDNTLGQLGNGGSQPSSRPVPVGVKAS